MPAHLYPAINYRTSSFLDKQEYFRRKDEKIKTKKIQRKIKLKHKHVFLMLFFVAGFFYCIQQLYFFLIAWDKLNINTVEIICPKPELKADIENYFSEKTLGNIILLDINRLHNALSEHPWVKNIYLRKIFPSSLRMEIKPRKPFAILKKNNLLLIDGDGTILENLDSNAPVNLPVLIDTNGFEKDFSEKLSLAWQCLDNLGPFKMEQVETLNLSDYGNVSLKFKESSTWIILGDDKFSEKLDLYHKKRAELEQHGMLEYVDLRIPSRVYFKAQNTSHEDDVTNSAKEAN